MRIVVLQDLNLKVTHAVLAVDLDGKTWILDNQIKQVIDAERIRHYRPVYSVNEKGWWLHKKAA
jgi:predicted transglutaminase-like cysteine proteinase